MNTYVEITAEQYQQAKCTSYTGGASWLRVPAYPNGHVVIACTPVEIRRYFDVNPNGRTSGRFVAEVTR